MPKVVTKVNYSNKVDKEDHDKVVAKVDELSKIVRYMETKLWDLSDLVIRLSGKSQLLREYLRHRELEHDFNSKDLKPNDYRVQILVSEKTRDLLRKIDEKQDLNKSNDKENEDTEVEDSESTWEPESSNGSSVGEK